MADYKNYFTHLQSISQLGRAYKRFVTSPILYYHARTFGTMIAEIGSGIGSGILGAYPKQVTGFDINPLAVDYCKSKSLPVHLIGENNLYSAKDGEFDACVLDNVLEHIAEPSFILQECLRITHDKAGLIIAVPGVKGYASDSDHKKFYGEQELQDLHPNWQLDNLFAMPFFVKSKLLSDVISQYCLVAVYSKQ